MASGQILIALLLVLLPVVTYSLPFRKMEERTFKDFVRQILANQNKKQRENDKFEIEQALARKECRFTLSFYILGHIKILNVFVKTK